MKIILLIVLISCSKNIERMPNLNKGINEDLIKYCKKGKQEKVLTLLNENPNINVNFKDKQGNTALFYAIQGDKEKDSEEPENVKEYNEIVNLLIDYGANINFPSEGKLLLDMAISRARLDMIRILLKKEVIIDKDDINL